ncbi:MAG: methylenetetrahydrofolate reductase [NAD(P)H] [Phenylobacterium sp.]|uniref:methylenetetrahydrofolate reductase [NAD(P)H] n=1 Tax=Phenylobacterium sp. TaxID=1871053 RepID=UPI00271A3B31|nr:methylenetetrahydrofolate reductase [NAD(P)H] [Phenylobacterium sp.]MDP3712894.1 methylenetetrahydrofolate reductase [NAD(P)H] [Mycobacteriales bacterium]MDO8912649.1 methylenetetrahydrofolate reductase [NAD(P)H] [Phenylobacterium sp.]MDP2008660.1 methylenetetrahydrofolate reductase [NAD(P)H] [Phenylobacterium sp.]MDP3101915.1 methylenetetrahydrofolate reductase [NAD(P)H] [Phenylobacterium sp.]MDP3867036.1 methylenetetrahydrofolate reductase [NAD(P)H] [Phenylobacterium sp.]
MSPLETALGPVARAGAGLAKRPSVSFEFSPPKGPKSEESLWEAIRRLEPLNPSFVSVTYGAGGSTRDRTHRTVVRMLHETTLRPAAHLTCVEASRAEVDEVIQDYWDAGIRHIVALRGDPPGSLGGAYTPRADGYQNATELTAGIRAIGDFDVSVGVYPQIHPESPSVDHDIDVLKAKIDAGATRAISNFFFDIDGYLRFVEKIRKAGVTIPILPGVMPVSGYEGLKNMSQRIGVTLPGWLGNLFEGLDDDVETRKLLACSVAAEMCARLVEEGFSDLHFYTLNRADLVYAICRVLGVREEPTEKAA